MIQIIHKFFTLKLEKIGHFLRKNLEKNFIDYLVKTLGIILMNLSAILSLRNSGNLQNYAFIFILGTLTLVCYCLT